MTPANTQQQWWATCQWLVLRTPSTPHSYILYLLNNIGVDRLCVVTNLLPETVINHALTASKYMKKGTNSIVITLILNVILNIPLDMAWTPTFKISQKMMILNFLFWAAMFILLKNTSQIYIRLKILQVKQWTGGGLKPSVIEFDTRMSCTYNSESNIIVNHVNNKYSSIFIAIKGCADIVTPSS